MLSSENLLLEFVICISTVIRGHMTNSNDKKGFVICIPAYMCRVSKIDKMYSEYTFA